MEVLKELVKFADELDKLGHTELANRVDTIIAKAAEKKDDGQGQPVLKMKVRKNDDEDGTYDVTIYAPSGVSPYDPVVQAYVKKYGPHAECNLDYLESVANSMPNEPNMFRYRLRGPKGNGPAAIPAAAAAALPTMLGSETIESLIKIADELDSAGALDLANKIDVLLKGAGA